MNKTVILSMILVFPILIFAQIQWQDNGIPLRIAQNLSSAQTVRFADGNHFATWSEMRNESRGIYAQKINNEGNLLWGEDDLEIVNVINSQWNSQAIATNDNCVILTWRDCRNPDVPELRIQKIDANGNFLWGDEGIVLCECLYMTSNQDLVLDCDNGIFIFWYILEYNNSGTYGAHILADGTLDPNWPGSSNMLFENSIYSAVIDPDENIVFSTVINDELFVQKMDENCNLLWGMNGKLISNYDSYSFVGRIVPNNDNTFYVVWRDRRVLDGIYCNLIDQNGNKIWNEDTELVAGYDYYYQKSTKSSDNNLIVCWLEDNNPTQIIVQKIDNTGAKQWGDSGVVASGNEESHIEGLIIDDDGGCWLSWMNVNSSNNISKLQHLNSSGSKLLEQNGMLVCLADGFQLYPSLNKAANNGVFLSWTDFREGKSGIYCQIADNAGNLVFEPEGVKIIDGISDEILGLEMIANSNGIYYLWKDKRFWDHNELMLQKINENGNILLQENGVSLNPGTDGYIRQFEYDYNESTELINVVWEDHQTSQTYTQAIEPTGSPVWPGSSIQLNSQFDWNCDPKISHKEEYSYVGWTAFDNSYPYDNNVIAQKIDQEGNLLWGSEGIVLDSYVGDDSLNAIAGNCFFWLSNDCNQFRLFAQMLDENGNPAPGWDDEGLWISNLETVDWFRDINPVAMDVQFAYMIFWKDLNNGDPIIYGQLISDDGDILWQDGGLLINDYFQYYQNFKTEFDNNDYSTYLIWEGSALVGNPAVYMQKLDIGGNTIWFEDGLFIAYGRNPDLAKIGDYILVVWEEETDDYTNDIRAQLINTNGELQWEPEGIVVCNAAHDQFEPKVEAIDEDNFVISWRDNRAGLYGENEVLCTSIYTQKIYFNSTSSPDEILNAITAELYQNYPNPFNPSTTISFNVTQSSAFATIEIYNLKGQKVKTFSNLQITQSQNQQIVWNGTDNNNKPVSSGIYFYKLKSGNIEKTKKMLLLK